MEKSSSPTEKYQEGFVEITIYTRHSVRCTVGKVTDYYEILEILGEGAFGCVRKVIHKELKVFMAMKSIIKSFVELSSYKNMLLEVDILRKLDHPNILKINEVIEDSKCFHIVTEICTGGELLERLIGEKQLKEKEVASYMYQILSAISYCHSKKVLHRDIKPENLMLEDPSEEAPLKIIDFGISKIIDSQNKYFKVGKAYYSAPETFDGTYIDKSDVWSCGIIMYLMLGGYLPFSKKPNTTLAYEIQNSQVEFPPKEWNSVSAEAKALVCLLLTKNSDNRPTAEEILSNPWFQQFLNSSGRKINLNSIQNLQAFQCKTKIQQATLEYIVSHLATNDEIKSLKETFMALDTNGDGKLSIEEISHALDLNNSIRLAGISEVIKRCDSDHSGFIDYTEFLSATIDWKMFLCNKKLEAAFRAFDLDGNGQIDLNELKEMIGGIDEVGCMNMMCQSDKNGDGGLDFEEFKEICLEISIIPAV
ncbi:hypothetical protein SteCoe_7815 [Stentor coeruleus]|uniref:non-specific serine/threonine protein kinase n=1 Tax=Stentor coeruleus TaxID=5963 RepID=A0A1R2CLP0_9CILI|nr:hypothetical protein SteCoe_7815 [Stentor coeruleus]